MRRRIASLFGVLCLLLAGTAQAQSVRIFYEADRETALINPYIGNAAWAREKSSLEQPFTLVYANLRWADFEPEEGQYDFAAFEEENQLDKWRAAGKHLILRFVLDLPQEKKHLDIPQWLYDQTGDGLFYRTPYGRGYSPNYENELLIAAHARAIAALGERYGSDPFVAFVELGSLGHWGE
ncbi:MAG: beta-galactosidase, partial [Clostridia bacterium]